jgi:hypothetical protein
MERRALPILHAIDKAMSHGIEVDVIKVLREVFVVAHGVFPEPSLPKRVLAFPIGRHTDFFCHSPSEQALDLSPSTRKVRVVLWQRHQGVKMIWKDDDCINRKRTLSPGHAEGNSQVADMLDKGVRSAVLQRDGEEVRRPGHEIAAISDHSSP